MDVDTEPQLSPLAPKPAHVPDQLVHDFDLWNDPEMTVDPHRRLERLAVEAPPLFWTPRNGGLWYLNRFEYSFEASRDWEMFSSVPARIPGVGVHDDGSAERTPVPLPIMLDPPTHGVFRAPLNRTFSPKKIDILEKDARAFVAGLIDDFVADGACEIVEQLAEPLPVTVFLKLVGLPVEQLPQYRELVRRQLSIPVDQYEATEAALREIVANMRETILDRRDRPQNDMISGLWQTTIEDRPPTLEEIEDYCSLLFTAGLDTVTNGIAFGLRHLATDPNLQDRLRRQPALIPEAVDEFLRRYAFVQGTRYVTADHVFHGVLLKADEQIMLNLPGAHLDNDRWTNAATVDIDREEKAHITFNAGPHRCVGSHLARMELRLTYEEFLSRVPPFRLDPDRPVVMHGGLVLGFDKLWVVWDT